MSWSDTGDSYIVHTTVDTEDVISESNELNNQETTSAFTITPDRLGNYSGYDLAHATMFSSLIYQLPTVSNIAINQVDLPWTATLWNPDGLSISNDLTVDADGSIHGSGYTVTYFTGNHPSPGPSPLVVQLGYTWVVAGRISVDRQMEFTLTVTRNVVSVYNAYSEDYPPFIDGEVRVYTFAGLAGSHG